jgi:hypothetical protein
MLKLQSGVLETTDVIELSKASLADDGTVSSGTYTPDCTVNDSRLVTIGGNITIDVPTVNLSAGEVQYGILELIGGDAYSVSFAAGWDWGDQDPPTLTARSLIMYYAKGSTISGIFAGGFS